MNVLPWVMALVGAVIAAVAAVADGALLSDAPTIDTPARDGLLTSHTEPHNAALGQALPKRERQHRALAFARLLGHGVAGGSVAIALHLGDRTTPSAIAVLVATGLITVSLAESIARAVGDALGERAAVLLAPFTRWCERLMSPLVYLGESLDRLVAAVVPDG